MSFPAALFLAANAVAALLLAEGPEPRVWISAMLLVAVTAASRSGVSGVTTLFATFYMFGLIVFELIQNPDGMTVQQPVIAEAYYSAVTRGQVIMSFLSVATIILCADIRSTLNLLLRVPRGRQIGLVMVVAASQARLLVHVSRRVWVGQWGRGLIQGKSLLARSFSYAAIFVPLTINFLVEGEHRADLSGLEGIADVDIHPGVLFANPARDIAFVCAGLALVWGGAAAINALG